MVACINLLLQTTSKNLEAALELVADTRYSDEEVQDHTEISEGSDYRIRITGKMP